MPVSAAALRDHTTAPSRASSAFRIPVAPNVYTRPLWSVGVARGPGPPFDSQKPGRVAMRPHRLAGGHAVAGDHLDRYRAAPGCKGGRRGPRRTTSRVRPAVATIRPAARQPSPSRSARRARCRRDGVRESRASRRLKMLSKLRRPESAHAQPAPWKSSPLPEQEESTPAPRWRQHAPQTSSPSSGPAEQSWAYRLREPPAGLRRSAPNATQNPKRARR